MTTFTLDENTSQYQIRSYQPGKIQVNEHTFTNSIIVAPNLLITDWQPQSVEELSIASFTQIISLKPAILLIGIGSKPCFLPIEVYGELLNHGIGVEIMETGAACRTFNALSAENRHVIAALLVQ